MVPDRAYHYAVMTESGPVHIRRQLLQPLRRPHQYLRRARPGLEFVTNGESGARDLLEVSAQLPGGGLLRLDCIPGDDDSVASRAVLGEHHRVRSGTQD